MNEAARVGAARVLNDNTHCNGSSQSVAQLLTLSELEKLEL